MHAQLSSHVCLCGSPMHVRMRDSGAGAEPARACCCVHPCLQGAASPTAQPHHTVVLLHGLLGSGRNWRMWARKLVDAAQAQSPTRLPLRMLLVDLRCHGGSTHLPRLAPPHTLAAAAQDVVRLIGQVVE